METLQHPITVFWLCVLMHLIADYTLQGCLTNLKQKSWWNEQLRDLAYSTRTPKIPEEQDRIFSKYQHDYLAGLACHALMWSIMTCLPLLLICSPRVFGAAVMINTVIHAIIDDLKANKLCINLWQDQLLHLIQVTATVVSVIA